MASVKTMFRTGKTTQLGKGLHGRIVVVFLVTGLFAPQTWRSCSSWPQHWISLTAISADKSELAWLPNPQARQVAKIHGPGGIRITVARLAQWYMRIKNWCLVTPWSPPNSEILYRHVSDPTQAPNLTSFEKSNYSLAGLAFGTSQAANALRLLQWNKLKCVRSTRR